MTIELTVKGKVINFIGDPHMGKKFNNVPLERKGEREEMQLDKFIEELNKPADITIMVGDLFDVHSVSNNCLNDVYQAIQAAAATNDNREFILMYGNHDISRDNSTVHSFDILRSLLTIESNVYCYQDVHLFNSKTGVNILVCPYQPFKTAKEAIAPFTKYDSDVVVGHWDCISFGDDHNVVPIDEIAEIDYTYIVTGHEHTGGDFECKDYSGKTHIVKRTGSMQPYSHGEDPNEELYVTRTVTQVEEELAVNPDAYNDKCLRILLTEGEEAPKLFIPCLQYSVKRVKKEEVSMDINLDETFSFKNIFIETFDNHEVSEETTKNYWNKYQQEASDAQVS